MKHLPQAGLALALAASVASAPAPAAEAYDNCSGYIDSVPAVISTQGTWCMRGDLATAIDIGNAITVTTNNVTIDCNHFKLGGLSAGAGTGAWGISGVDRSNLTVRNCNVRGFLHGVSLGGDTAVGNVVEDSRFDGNTRVGIGVTGDGSVVRRNLVNDTGGSNWSSPALGIATTGSVDVIDNSVSGVQPQTGAAYGIYTFNNFFGVVSGNRVRQLVPAGGSTVYGIFNQTFGRVVVRGNDVFGSAILGSVGIRCQDATGVARDNVITGFETAIETCGNDGGNVVRN